MIDKKAFSDKSLNSLRNIILRPVAIFSVSFFVVLCILFSVGGANTLILSAVLFVIDAGILIFYIKSRKDSVLSSFYFAFFMLFLGIASAFLFSYTVFSVKLSPYLKYDGKTVPLTGHIEEVYISKPYMGEYIMNTHTFNGYDRKVKIKITAAGDLKRGDTVSGTFTINTLYNNKGQPQNGGSYYLPDNILLTGTSDDLQYTGEYEFSAFSKLRDFRDTMSSFLIRTLGEKDGGFCAAVFLGDRNMLSDSVMRDFKRLGISHILALSGMHLSVICSLIYFFTKRLNIYLRCLIQCGVVLFYMLFTGFSPSVARAGFMLIFVCAASLVHHSSDMITNIGLAVLLITLINPFSPGDIGLQLSAGAVFAIALATGNAKKRELILSEKVKFLSKRSFGSYILNGIFISAAIIIFLIPLEYRLFSSISPLTPLVSLIITVPVTLLLWLLPFMFLFAPLPFMTAALKFAISQICKFTFFITGIMSRIPDVCVTVKYPFSALLCAAVFISFIVFAASRKKVRLISGIVCFCLFVSLILGGYVYTFSQRSTELIYSSNYLKNDAVTVLCDGKATVIDISDGHYTNISNAVSVPFAINYTEEENIVLTHLHSYHKATMSSIFGDTVIRNLYIPYTDENSSICSSLEELCAEYGVSFHIYSPGDTLTLGDSFEIRTYEYEYISRSVQPVVRFDLNVGKNSFTYLSASYSELHSGEKIMSDIVFFGDHGPLYKKDICLDLSEVKHITCFESAKDLYHGKLRSSPLYLLPLK